jgi:hypothetical protein
MQLLEAVVIGLVVVAVLGNVLDIVRALLQSC